jgi:hypothetical protein
MKENNHESFLSAMRFIPEQWKWDFIVDRLCGFITAQNIPVDETFAEHLMNKLLGGIIALRASANTDDGFALIMKCLQKFSNNWKQYLCFAFGIERALQGISNEKEISDKLWTLIIQFVTKNYAANKQNVFAFLLTQKKYEMVIALYKNWILTASNNEIAKTLFQEQLGIQDIEYVRQFFSEICECYYEFLLKHNQSSILSAEKELLTLILQRNIPFRFIDKLVDNALSDIPIVVTSEKHKEFIKAITVYYRSQSKTHYAGRLLVLVAGMVFGRGIHGKGLEAVAEDIKASAGGRPVDLTALPPKETERYIEWIVPILFKSCQMS